jgi:competence protein CoiA
MKFSLVDGERQEAQPNLSGKCPACDQAMVPKCGEVKIWHWAHKGRRDCDSWWENETEWHRAWKNHFPPDWQERVRYAGDGERHIADVETTHGWVIELQHSSISPEERRSRDAFYRNVVWVVDGTRRKTDTAKFARAWDQGTPAGRMFPVQRVHANDCALLRDWSDSVAPIFFDFGGQALAWLLPGRFNGFVYVTQFPRDQFIHIHLTGVVQAGLDFAGLVRELSDLVARNESPVTSPPPLSPLRQAQVVAPNPSPPRIIKRHFRF